MFSSTVTIWILSVCTLLVFGLANAVPVQQQPEYELGGYATVLWSVLEDCLDGDSDEPAMVCFKTKALTALDRALSKPTVTVVDGVLLATRAGKSLPIDLQAEKEDLVALDAAKNSEEKNALLDDILANRMDRLMSTRSIVLDGAQGQEGRKKKDKALQQAMIMIGITAAAVLGPLMLKMIALLAAKALFLSKIALVLSGLIALKKIFQPQQSSHSHGTETVSYHHGRSMQLDAHDMAYASQKL